MSIAGKQRFAVKALYDLAFLKSNSLTMALRVNNADLNLAHGFQVIMGHWKS